MPRFFVEEKPQGRVFLGGEEGRHGAKALRLRPGEEVTLCDGCGQDYLCLVEEVQREGLWLDVRETRPSLGEPRTQVTVCQCWPKGDKLETVTQKAVELGAAEIRLVESARCVVRLDGKAREKKTARLQKIAREAAMQSGRGIIPQVLAPAPLEQVLKNAAAKGEILFFYEEGRDSLKEALRQAGQRLFVFVGPEGGFSPEEAALAQSLGGRLLTLGPRILRTETAPLAALAAILYEKGDMERRGEPV